MEESTTGMSNEQAVEALFGPGIPSPLEVAVARQRRINAARDRARREAEAARERDFRARCTERSVFATTTSQGWRE